MVSEYGDEETATFWNNWIFGLCSSSGMLETREHSVSVTVSVSVLR
jgi:hypothetical protein